MLGHPFVATMVETFSIERRKVMRALGAKVILTPAAERGSGMVARAEALAEQHGWFWRGSFRTQPTRPITQAPQGRRFCRTLPGSDWIIG